MKLLLLLISMTCHAQVDEYRAMLFVRTRINALHTNHTPAFAFRNAIDSRMTNILAEWVTITNHIRPGMLVDVWWMNRTADECITNRCPVGFPSPFKNESSSKQVHEKYFKRVTNLGTNYIEVSAPHGSTANLVYTHEGFWSVETVKIRIPDSAKLREMFP